MKRTSRGTPSGPVLVTGGAGFIGSHVVEALLERGNEVRVLDDLSTGHAEHLPLHDPNLELQVGDVTDRDAMLAALRGVRACIHLAAQPAAARPTVDPYDTALANVTGFINLLDAARLQRVKRVLFASGDSVYGEAPEPPFAENTARHPTGPDGMEKLLAEGYATLFASRHGLRTLALRYFSVYGPRQHTRDGIIPNFLERLDARRPVLIYGDGRQRRDFIHVEDAARATVAALDSGQCGALNVASGQPTEIRELVQLLGYALDLQPLMHFAAARPGDVAGSWADIAQLRRLTGEAPARSLRSGLAALASDRAARRRREEVTATQISPPSPRATAAASRV
jgi:UDP-glucose 4-epimerase